MNTSLVTLTDIDHAAEVLKKVGVETPLQYSRRLSEKYHAKIYIKREDLQEVRSFKIRGAFNKMSALTVEEQKNGIVTASSGNHAQGVAYSCSALKIHGVIFMPTVTPNQKIEKVKKFGGSYVKVTLVGKNYDETKHEAKQYCTDAGSVFIEAFDDPAIIAGQGTIGKEIYEELGGQFDVLVSQIGGGGLISGIGLYIKERVKKVTIVGVQAEGAPGMNESIKSGEIVSLKKVDPFVDGTAVGRVGKATFALCRKYVDKIVVLPEGQVCTTMIELYQNDGIVAEPAGALAISALEELKDSIRNKTVVCLISGGNNDIMRYPEIVERSLVYQGRKHYFMIEFAQKPGQLKRFLNEALGAHDDIVLFEYIKKNNKEKGPALVGIELQDRKDYVPLIARMDAVGIQYRKIESDDMLFNYLI